MRVRTDEKEAAGPALGKDGLCAGQLVGTAVVVVDRRRIAARLQTGLQLVQQIRKQSVLRALYNEGQPLRHLLLQMLGIGVGLVAVLRHNGQYFPACVLADAGVVVQHAGHCAHGIAGLAGNILDGQSCAFFRVDLLPVYHIQQKGERGGSLRILRGAFYFFGF